MLRSILLTLIFGGISFISLAQDAVYSPATIHNSNMETIWSPENDTEYLILVSLPLDYHFSDRSYPVIYLLDPQIGFGTVTELYRAMAWGSELPELIIVSIGYPEFLEWGISQPITKSSRPTKEERDFWEKRQHDYAGAGRDDFHDFLTQTLIPRIDSTYRTDPTDRAIAGHSDGGIFVSHVLCTSPDTFNRYLISSPAIFFRECDITISGDRNIRVFISAGEHEADFTIKQALNQLDELNVENLHVSSAIFEGETHISVIAVALIRGAKRIYCTEHSTERCTQT